MRIFIIRHGESFGNIDREIYAKDSDVPVTEFGFHQAVGAGQALKPYLARPGEMEGRVIEIKCSPQLRTRQTHEGLLHGLENAVRTNTEYSHLLIERKCGLECQFRPYQDTPGFSESSRIKRRQQRRTQSQRDFRNAFPKEVKAYREALDKDPMTARIPFGESPRDVEDGMREFYQMLMREEAKGTEDLIVVAHGDTIQVLETLIMGRELDDLAKTPRMSNCDINLFEGSFAEGFRKYSVYKAPLRPAGKTDDTAPYGFSQSEEGASSLIR